MTPHTDTIKQLASVLRKQIASARERVGFYALGATDRSYLPWMEGGNIPSRNEQFYYVARPDGLVQIQQDAAFVVEHVIMAPRLAAVLQLDTVCALDVTFIDTNSGRAFTDGTKPSIDTSQTGQNTVQTGQGVSPSALVPIGASATAAGVWQWDAWFSLNAELMLPRGGSVRALSTVQVNTSVQVYELRSYVLAGYKVYG